MAERRMFTEKITDADAFTSMPSSAQALYFHLNMNADDDGFCNKINLCMVNSKASTDDFKILLAKRFIIQFESGVIVIKHWRMHNLLRKDRYNETDYLEEKSRLFLKDNGSYTLDENQGKSLVATKCQPNGNQMATEDSIGKNNNIVVQAPTLPPSPPKKQSNPDPTIAKQIIDYLNAKTGKGFRATTKATKEFINARLKEGRTLVDFQFVIDNRVKEWKGSKMEEYLRPSTLFAPTNFENYLNSKDVAPQKNETTKTYRELD